MLGNWGSDDPDLLDIPPPMMYEAWSDGVEERGTEERGPAN